MNASTNGHLVPFHISVSAAIAATIRREHERAKSAGLGEEFKASLVSIIGQLREDPWQFGEPTFNLEHSNSVVCAGAQGPVAVEFLIPRDQHDVVLRSVRFVGT